MIIKWDIGSTNPRPQSAGAILKIPSAANLRDHALSDTLVL